MFREYLINNKVYFNFSRCCCCCVSLFLFFLFWWASCYNQTSVLNITLKNIDIRPAKVDHVFLVKRFGSKRLCCFFYQTYLLSHRNEGLADVFLTMFIDNHKWLHCCSKHTFAALFSSIWRLNQTTATALCHFYQKLKLNEYCHWKILSFSWKWLARNMKSTSAGLTKKTRGYIVRSLSRTGSCKFKKYCFCGTASAVP